MIEPPVSRIKPNITKAFIANLIFVAAIVILLISLIIYLNNLVGIDIFFDTFKEFGINITKTSVLFGMIGLVLLFTTLLLILNYVSLAKVTYTFYPDRIEYTRNFLIMQLSSKTIPLKNISKVFSSNKSLMKTGKVTLELSGLKDAKIDINYVDNPLQVVNLIQELIHRYKANYYAQYAQDYRFQTIVDRY